MKIAEIIKLKLEKEQTMEVEFYFSVIGVLFGISFTIWIFVKCYSDNKKDKAIITEIYKKYGVKTTAKIIRCGEHINTKRTMPYKYELLVEFNYNSPAKSCLCPCLAKILTNNPACKEYEDFIRIIYIPQYADYVNEFADSKKLCQNIGIKVYQYSAEMIIWADEISIYTNLDIF